MPAFLFDSFSQTVCRRILIPFGRLSAQRFESLRAILFSILIVWLATQYAAGEVSTSVAKPLAVEIIAASAETPDRLYLAFPAVVDLGAEVLVSFKRGRLHAGDLDARLEWLCYDKKSGRTLPQGTLAAIEGEIMQMGEWVRFPNGDIANYVDAQKPKSLRTGLAVVRSTDSGRTFGKIERVGLVDGVEYGYAFDSISRNGSTWMLVMTFANLPGGKLVYQSASQPGSVDVIRSDDNGHTWRFVRSLTHELGSVPINESAFIPHSEGFLIASRGYDGRQWLFRTDADFKVVAKTDLRGAHPSSNPWTVRAYLNVGVRSIYSGATVMVNGLRNSLCSSLIPIRSL